MPRSHWNIIVREPKQARWRVRWRCIITAVPDPVPKDLGEANVMAGRRIQGSSGAALEIGGLL